MELFSRLRSRLLTEFTRQITPPTKKRHATPAIESRKSYQSVKQIWREMGMLGSKGNPPIVAFLIDSPNQKRPLHKTYFSIRRNLGTAPGWKGQPVLNRIRISPEEKPYFNKGHPYTVDLLNPKVPGIDLHLLAWRICESVPKRVSLDNVNTASLFGGIVGR